MPSKWVSFQSAATHHPRGSNLRAYVELLAHYLRDTCGDIGIDDRPHLRSEDAHAPGPLQQRLESRVRLHQAHAAAHRFKPLVHFQERHDTAVFPKELGHGLSLHQAVHSGFEQDSADDPSTGERWRRHDANAKLMHQLQHLRISRVGTVRYPVLAQRSGRGATALIERRYKPLVTSDLGQHLLSGHNGFLSVRC